MTSPDLQVPAAELERVAHGEHPSPHDILGAHAGDGSFTVRALRPGARTVEVHLHGDDVRIPMEHEHAGVWVAQVPGTDVPDYGYAVTYADGVEHHAEDPYRYLPTLGEIDLHLIGEGRHEQLWTVLGAHVRTYAGPHGDVTGTSFAVWAPHARGVRVLGDFSFWDGQAYPMRSLGSSGVWELFVPGVVEGALYKFAVCDVDGRWTERADPMARRTQVPPAWASIVESSTYDWSDADWMRRRTARAPHESPMSTYEVHLPSWRRGRSYADLADELVAYVSETGFTHVELMPVMEHPFGGSWGYHVTGYYAPTARLGEPDDLRLLIDRLHQAGIGVILDWVPGHFATDPWALVTFDGTALYEHPDPKRGWHPEWGSYIFNLGRNEVRNFLMANANYWLEEFHADGLRVDGVASMLYLDYARDDGEWQPNEHGGRENLEAVRFLQEVNATVYRRNPGCCVIAEESTSWPGVTQPTDAGGLGFGMKWNMGWMHDSLGYLAHEPIYRQHHHHEMTFSLVYAYTENFVLPISHDEVVHGKGSLLRKMPGDRWQQLANVRAYLAFMWAHPGKQLLFMGCELAQEAEWAESRELDWWLLDHVEHRGVKDVVRDLNRVYVDTAALWSSDQDPDGFAWIDANDTSNNVFSFARSGDDGSMLVSVSNFAAVPHHDYRLGFPEEGVWQEVLNTDAEAYSGSGVGNFGQVTAVAEPHHGMRASATVQLPPLATVWFRREASAPGISR